MITKLSVDYEIPSDPVAAIVGDTSKKMNIEEGDTLKCYVRAIMTGIEKGDTEEETKVILQPASDFCINDPACMPTFYTDCTTTNYINLTSKFEEKDYPIGDTGYADFHNDVLLEGYFGKS